MTIRVLVADDQSMVRAGFRILLAGEEDIEVVAEASNGLEAVDKARAEWEGLVSGAVETEDADLRARFESACERVVEHIRVEMDPEAFQFGTTEVLDRSPRGRGDPIPSYRGQIPGAQVRWQRRRAVEEAALVLCQ